MYSVNWFSNKSEEYYGFTYDRKDYALRHADDMFCQGYDVSVLEKENVIFRKSHSSGTGKIVYFIAPKLDENYKTDSFLRVFDTRWERMLNANVMNLFYNEEDANRIIRIESNEDFWEVLSHEIEGEI